LTDFRNDSHPHHSVVLVNLNRIQKVGVRNWLTEQKTRWSCSMCGTRFTWYDETCAHCGSILYNCRSEENDLPGKDGQV
jgi:rRNA maturation endonuclease Nob1